MLTNFQGISIKNKNLNSALRPETTLQWMGFTDLGTPAMQDSGGLLSLSPLSANVWLPFCDTTKHVGFVVLIINEIFCDLLFV